MSETLTQNGSDYWENTNVNHRTLGCIVVKERNNERDHSGSDPYIFLATPLEVDDIVAGEMLWCATKGLFSSSAILLVASLLGAISHWQAILCIPLFFLTGLCFAGPAIMVASFSRSYDFFNYYVTLVLTPMFIFCGVFYPVATLPDFAQSMVKLLPLSHAIAVIRPLAAGQELSQVIIHVSVLLSFVLISFYLAVVLVRRRLIQ